MHVLLIPSSDAIGIDRGSRRTYVTADDERASFTIMRWSVVVAAVGPFASTLASSAARAEAGRVFRSHQGRPVDWLAPRPGEGHPTKPEVLLLGTLDCCVRSRSIVCRLLNSFLIICCSTSSSLRRFMCVFSVRCHDGCCIAALEVADMYMSI